MGKVIYVSFKGRSRGRIIDTVGETVEEIINSPPLELLEEEVEEDEKDPA